MGRVRFRGRDWVKSVFLDSNVDPGTCLTWKNHSNHHPMMSELHNVIHKIKAILSSHFCKMNNTNNYSHKRLIVLIIFIVLEEL